MQHTFSMKFVFIIFVALSITMGSGAIAHAQDEMTSTDVPQLSEQECAQLLGVPDLGIIRDVDKKLLLNPQVCQAYAYLISRYSPGASSSMGLSNPQVEGITKLNQNFAVNLYNMMRAADAAGLNIRIISAYRTCEAQLSANPNGWGGNCYGSLHTQGRAVDFAWSKSNCSSAECKFAKQYTASGSSCLAFYNDAHAFVSGEANHVEDICNDTKPIDVEDIVGANPGAPESTPIVPTEVTDLIGSFLGGGTNAQDSGMTLESIVGDVFTTIFGEVPLFGEKGAIPSVSQQAPQEGEVLVVSEDGTIIARSNVSMEDALAKASVFFNSSTISEGAISSLGGGLLGNLFPQTSNGQQGSLGVFQQVFKLGAGNTFGQPAFGTTTSGSFATSGNGGLQFVQTFIQTIFGILGNIIGGLSVGR